MNAQVEAARAARGDRDRDRSRRRRGNLCAPGPTAARLAIALAIGLVAVGTAHADPPRFQGEVDREEVVVGEPFIYQVTLGIGNEQATDYRPPDFKGCRVLSAPASPNQSTQMQFGNGGMFVEVSYSWRYQLAATQKGRINIGPARVRVNGQEFRSSVVTVSASPPGAGGGAQAAAPPQPQPGAGTDPGAIPGSGFGQRLPSEVQEGSFIRLVIDKPKAFVGEAISASWVLYENQSLDRYDTQVEPRMEGFWTEDVTVPSRRGGSVLTQEMIDGRPYQVGTVLKKALFPLQPGRLTITPMEAQIARIDFFGSAVQSQRVRSTPTVIEVLPLPKAGQPPGFDQAAVGTFAITARADRTTVAVGEAVTLTIELKGRGNLRKVPLPTVPRLDGWKSYEPRVNVVVDPATGVSGTKTAEVLLLPERAGAITLPALALDTFDPEARRYARVASAPITLTATGDGAAVARAGTGATAPAANGGGFVENVIAGEIRPIHAHAELRRDLGSTFFRTRAFVGVLAFPPLALALAMVGFGFRDRLGQDSGANRRRRARKKVRAHLRAADAHRARGETGAFFIEIDRVIREVLSGRIGRPVTGLRMDELRALIADRGLPAADCDRVIALLEECDRARFAPGGVVSDAASLAAIVERASELIDAVERAPLREEARA
jgi:hypothetical protein